MSGDMSKTFIGKTKREEFKEFEEIYKGVEAFMGYLPNAHLTMSESPGLLLAFSQLARTIFQSNSLDIQTKQLIALASSLSAGCKYCQAHTSHGADRAGVDQEKIAQILNYTDSKKYSKEERAVLDLAFAAGKVPNMSTKKHFDNLRKYYSKKEIVDIVSVISLFGFLNRWNDTLGTALEEVPENFVNDKLKPLGWI
tara:strand:+ start:28 stop:618 length:591 start_codon:yes stop_codon:yes gene_type:complete